MYRSQIAFGRYVTYGCEIIFPCIEIFVLGDIKRIREEWSGEEGEGERGRGKG